uniref:Uncharacterized protein n=1 Tax=Ditylenchus dipsaci TaxID=166011 RepID=A0A915DZU9_9BILA
MCDNEERTALHYAVEANHLACAKVLLENDADVNAKTRTRNPVYQLPNLFTWFNLEKRSYLLTSTKTIHGALELACLDFQTSQLAIYQFFVFWIMPPKDFSTYFTGEGVKLESDDLLQSVKKVFQDIGIYLFNNTDILEDLGSDTLHSFAEISTHCCIVTIRIGLD